MGALRFAAMWVALYLISVIVWLVLVSFWQFQEFQAACIKMDKDCDPEPLLLLCQEVLAQNGRSLFYRLYESFALVMLGKSEAAAQKLPTLEDDQQLRKKPSLYKIYCVLHSDLAPVDEAAAWLDRLEQQAGKAPGMERELEGHRACLKLRRGETEGLEPLFLDRLAHAPNLRAEIAWRWELGQLCLLQGKSEEGWLHLEYIAEHGNKLAIRAEAETLLKGLEKGSARTE